LLPNIATWLQGKKGFKIFIISIIEIY